MKCQCCNKRQATVRDYRERYQNISKYFVCGECLHKADRTFFAVMGKTNKRLSK